MKPWRLFSETFNKKVQIPNFWSICFCIYILSNNNHTFLSVQIGSMYSILLIFSVKGCVYHILLNENVRRYLFLLKQSYLFTFWPLMWISKSSKSRSVTAGVCLSVHVCSRLYVCVCLCSCCVCVPFTSNCPALFDRPWKASLCRVSCTSGLTLFLATSNVGPRRHAPSTSFTTWPTRAPSTSTASPVIPQCAR